MSLAHAEPSHVCSKCDPAFPSEGDGTLPWQEDEGSPWRTDCPLEAVPEWVIEASAWHRRGKRHVDPVTSGRAPWLTGAFMEAMDAFDAAELIEQAKAIRRAAAKK